MREVGIRETRRLEKERVNKWDKYAISTGIMLLEGMSPENILIVRMIEINGIGQSMNANLSSA